LAQRFQEVNDIVFSDIQESGRMKTISLEGSVYEGVLQKRMLGITSDYLIDIFECQSDAVHTYDYLLHDEGELIVEISKPMQEYDGFTKDYQLEPIDSESKIEGNQWLRKGLKASVDKAWKATFGTALGKRVVLHVGAETATEVFKTNTPIYSSAGWDNTPEDIRKMSKPMLIIRRKCKSTKFVVVHQLTNLDKKYEVRVNKNDIEIIANDFSDLIEIKGENIIHKSGQLNDFKF
jgi:hypothetical protein